VYVGGVRDALSVAVGAEHACALQRGGTVTCWGDNRFGQLGLGHNRPVHGAASDKVLPAVLGLRAVRAIAAGDYVTCALLQAGTVQCWGLNTEGQLGTPLERQCAQHSTGPVTCSPRPTTVRGLRDVDQIALGPNHGCAHTRFNRIFCWGSNEYTQIGAHGASSCLRLNYDSCKDYVPPRKIACSRAALEVSLPRASNAVVLADRQTCAFYGDQSYACWGAPVDHMQGLAGKPWRAANVARGENISAVLSDGGMVHLFHRDQFVPVVILPSLAEPTAAPLTQSPPPELRCARAQRPLARCGKFLAEREVFALDDSALGKTVLLRGRLAPPASATMEGDPIVSLALHDRTNQAVVLELRGGLAAECSGTGCCDIQFVEADVVASGVVRRPEPATGSAPYRLAAASLCQAQ